MLPWLLLLVRKMWLCAQLLKRMHQEDWSHIMPLHKPLTDVYLAAMAAAAGVRKVCFCT